MDDTAVFDAFSEVDIQLREKGATLEQIVFALQQHRDLINEEIESREE